MKEVIFLYGLRIQKTTKSGSSVVPGRFRINAPIPCPRFLYDYYKACTTETSVLRDGGSYAIVLASDAYQGELRERSAAFQRTISHPSSAVPERFFSGIPERRIQEAYDLRGWPRGTVLDRRALGCWFGTRHDVRSVSDAW